jgi:hypothetical protein
VFALVGTSKLQILVWCPLRLLDESVQQDHAAKFVNVKEHSRDPIARQIRSDLVQPLC